MARLKQEVLFDPRFLEQYTGRALLSDPVTAVVELVANSWDAGSTNVQIDWPSAMGERLRISDNGRGMTEEQFLRRWRTFSYDRLKEQGETVSVLGRPELPTRHVFGRNGIGRFAGFCFGSEYIVTTCADGKQVVYTVRRGIAQPIEVEKRAENECAESGTTIEIIQKSQSPLSPDCIRSELGKRFLTDPAFEVSVNSVRVDFEDISEKGIDHITIPMGDLPPIKILMIDTERTDRTTKQHGVAWHVNKRLVGTCGWSGNGFDDLVDGRRVEAKRYTFIIFADCLATTDAVKSDWTGFNEENELYKKVRQEVIPELRQRLLCSLKERREQTTKEVRHFNADKLRQMAPLSREKWNEFVESIQEACPTLSQPELQSLSGVLANLEISHSRYGLLHRLHELNPDQLDDLNKILAEWTVDMAKIVLDELQVRLKLVDELLAKTSSPDTPEVQGLQPLFHRGLWIFGPEFETIEFTSNQGMTTVIQNLFGKKGKGSLKRPDFVVLPDGSSGFYSYPKYDSETNAEVGVDHLVIVELKRPGVVVSSDQKNQCWEYVKELFKKGLLVDYSRVTCYVLGSKLEAAESGLRKEMDDRVRILPMTFNTVLQRAKSRLLKLYDRVKTAPFLQGKEIEKFLGESVEPSDELSLNVESAKEKGSQESAIKV